MLQFPLLRVYVYESMDSQLAVQAGAAYWQLEGFYGNTLQDLEVDICDLDETNSLARRHGTSRLDVKLKLRLRHENISRPSGKR